MGLGLPVLCTAVILTWAGLILPLFIIFLWAVSTDFLAHSWQIHLLLVDPAFLYYEEVGLASCLLDYQAVCLQEVQKRD